VSAETLFVLVSAAVVPGWLLLMVAPYLLLAGWIHYLAFDLFVGAWEVRDAAGRGVTLGLEAARGGVTR
jgi:hypothetical protein